MIYNFFIINPGGLTMKKYIVTLSKDERESLGNLVSRGKHRSQKILNALILLDCDTGEFQTNRSTNEEIARVLNISMKKIDRVKKRFVEEGFDVALDKRKADRVYTKHRFSLIFMSITQQRLLSEQPIQELRTSKEHIVEVDLTFSCCVILYDD